MIQMYKLNDRDTVKIEVIVPTTETHLATIHVDPPYNEVPGMIRIVAHGAIHPDYIDEIIQTLLDARRVSKGLLSII